MANHELRTPVAIIKMGAQLMKRRGTYDDRAVDTILSQTDQLGRLIEDLLATSQIEADRLELRLAETDLAVEARGVVEHLQLAGRAVRVDVPAEPVVVLADRQRLVQVFVNLLTNAAKYSPEGSLIVLTVARRGSEAHVSVQDQGVGIPADALPRLFSRFFRVEGTAARVQGVGVGLYITRRIVEAHGGRITVASEPGRGSIFTVILPRSEPKASDTPDH